MRILLKLLDLLLAVLLLAVYALWFILMLMRRVLFLRKQPPSSRPNLLVLDMAYTLQMVRERKLEQSILIRDVEGYFGHVWSVHPCASVVYDANANDAWGRMSRTSFHERHTVIEGKAGWSEKFAALPTANFLLAQMHVWWELSGLIRREPIHLIRVGDPYYLGIMGVALGLWTAVPVMIRVNFNYDQHFAVTGRPVNPRLFRKRWVEKIVERLTFPRFALIAGANEDNMNYGIANGGKRERGTVFRYGNLIHPAHWVAPQERVVAEEILDSLGIRDKAFGITVSRLTAMKRMDHLVRVVHWLKEHGEDFIAVVAGDGDLRPELETLAEELGVSERIRFMGNMPQDWLARIIPHASVVVSPHMGRALTESALGAVPLVAYDYDWQREVVLDGDTGFLVPDGEWEQMARAVQRVLREPEQAIRMGQRAREHVAHMMDPERLNRHERERYDSLLGEYFGTS